MKLMQIGGALMGAQKVIEEAIHSYALEHGNDSCILYACGTPSMEGEICYESKIENLLTRGLRKYVIKHPLCSVLQTLRLIRYIKHFKPDIVHLHVLHHGYTDYELLFRFLAKANTPVVYTMHDMWAMTGGCYHYSATGCSGYQSGCKDCAAAQVYLDITKKYVSSSHKKKEKMLSKLNKLHLVTVSNWVKQELQAGFLSDYPITVISNGIPMDAVANPEKCWGDNPEGKIRLLSVATTWTKKKGIHILLELAKNLGAEFEIYLVGAASEAVKKDAPSNVVFLGYCKDRAELFAYYRDADLYISASQEETFGMTFVEAAVMGTRSIGYASTAIGETLQSVYGKAVNEYSAEAFADAVRKVMAQPSCRLTDEQIDDVRRSCSTKRMAKDYMNLYCRVMQND